MLGELETTNQHCCFLPFSLFGCVCCIYIFIYIYLPLSCSAFMEPSDAFMAPEMQQRRMEIKINWVKRSWLVSTNFLVYHFFPSCGRLNNHWADCLISSVQRQADESFVGSGGR